MKVKDKFLESQTIDKLGAFINTTFSNHKYNWKTNITWQDSLNKVNNVQSGVIQQLQIPNQLVPEIVSKFNDLYPQTKDKNFYINFQLFHPLAFINKHEDQNSIVAATIYLNEEKWDVNWGGLFYYREHNSYRIILPKFNRAVINSDNIEHGVTSLNMGAPYRKSIQIFIKND